ncbi:hypothetical protein HYPSUDRAFT_65155 [Hypholoma sublateritium FD-334 SS-4]|uniref:Uncharacterized protein n=1 Tax=Hypholoma sublateritium (strain FD-334 SS-4) TaxID=945553 RepID=A0A0D2PZS4_HYPSF|nr:hypothetical protein HYPSUDRAFT_65155 [Hypholoma sublateritium FD-334 SS-4]
MSPDPLHLSKDTPVTRPRKQSVLPPISAPSADFLPIPNKSVAVIRAVCYEKHHTMCPKPREDAILPDRLIDSTDKNKPKVILTEGQCVR